MNEAFDSNAGTSSENSIWNSSKPQPVSIQLQFLTFIPALGVMMVIFFASSLRGEDVKLPDFAFSDKLAHFCIYSLLGMALSMRPRWMKVWGKVQFPPKQTWHWIIGVGFGLSDEIHQIFVPGRQAGWEDWVADTLGVLFGWWILRMNLSNPVSKRATDNLSEPD